MKKINWYLNRLSLMDPREILYRTRRAVINKFESRFLKDIAPDTRLEDKPVHWFFDPKDPKTVAEALEKLGLFDEGPAQKLLQHRLSFFALNDYDFGSAINWHRDYKNDRQAPVIYCKDLDYRDFNQVGDFKYIWETNRHQFLITLAKAYFITQNDAYKKEVVRLIDDWIDHNPYKQGINWSSSLELGVRLISWAWIWFYIGETEINFRNKWLASIYKHCKVISETYAGYSSANNHLIGEVAGLYIASVVWPFPDQSARWRKESYDYLVREIEKQTYADGVNKEQALSYAQFVFDFFLLAALLGEKNGQNFPENYWHRLEKKAEFLASIMNMNGVIPEYGDSDDGWAVILDENENFNPYQSILSTASVIFKRPDLKSKSSSWDQKSFWLLGEEGYKIFDQLPIEPFIPLKEFNNGGYYLLGKDEGQPTEVKALFDCGPLGYLSLAAHGHADSLNLTLSVGGEQFLIDPGTYTYLNSNAWRDYFKGTAAHNTVRIDGIDQSVLGGNFMWLKKAQSTVMIFESTDSYDHVAGRHDGYMRLADPVKHLRNVHFDKVNNVITIKDQIEARKEHTIEQYFHFDKNCVIAQKESNEWFITNKGTQIRLIMAPALQVSIYHGGIDPIFGWQSTRYDKKDKAYTFVGTVRTRGAMNLETKIYL